MFSIFLLSVFCLCFSFFAPFVFVFFHVRCLVIVKFISFIRLSLILPIVSNLLIALAALIQPTVQALRAGVGRPLCYSQLRPKQRLVRDCFHGLQSADNAVFPDSDNGPSGSCQCCGPNTIRGSQSWRTWMEQRNGTSTAACRSLVSPFSFTLSCSRFVALATGQYVQLESSYLYLTWRAQQSLCKSAPFTVHITAVFKSLTFTITKSNNCCSLHSPCIYRMLVAGARFFPKLLSAQTGRALILH